MPFDTFHTFNPNKFKYRFVGRFQCAPQRLQFPMRAMRLLNISERIIPLKPNLLLLSAEGP